MSPRSSIPTGVRSAVALAVATTSAKLPMWVRSRIGRLLGRVFSAFPTRERSVAEGQLRWLLPQCNRDSVIPAMYASLGQTALESLNLMPYLRKLDRHVELDGEAHIQRALTSPKASIFLSAHTANWDLLAAYGIQRGLDLHVVGVEARNEALQPVLDRLRRSYGAKTLWRRSGNGRELVRLLKEGKPIAALIDQDTTVQSVLSPFFGIPASTPSVLIELAKRYQAHLFSAFIIRTGSETFRIEVRPLDGELTVTEILNEYHRRLEELVRRHPEQWVWFHKRWRTLSDGRRLSSREYLEYLKAQERNPGNDARTSPGQEVRES